MNDIYLYPEVPVLKNKLGIRDEKILDIVEAEQSVANMALLYDLGFSDFTNRGICHIHKTLFGDVYDWAGQYRAINIKKREAILAGKSVWYSNAEDIERDLNRAWKVIRHVDWETLDRETFAQKIARTFPALWQVHPFREGNTRTIVMLMTFFAEHYGYFFDQELLAASAGYVRNAFVLASQDEFSEYEHLEKILLDAICTEPPFCAEQETENKITEERQEKYKKYHTKGYAAVPHEYRPDSEK
ncbi:Fic/DOC family protein [Allofournierella sp.]|uniref:Fic/DOC family protein n=1 Tax=Allofournierella sp. TaxID=1940256 RepID=UPI003AEFE812